MIKFEKHKLQLRLTVTGDFNPEEFSEAVGITPDKQWRQGETIKNSSMRHREAGWQVVGDSSEKLDSDSQLQIIFDKINPNLKKFISYSNDLDVELVFLVFTSMSASGIESMPGIHIGKDSMKALNAIKAEIDFDLYMIP